MKSNKIILGIILVSLLSSCSLYSISSGSSKPSADNSSSTDSGSGSSSTSEHTHTFEKGWTTDDTYHWHKSTCGHDVVDGKSEHSFEDVVTNPTYDLGGYTTHTCTVCGYSYTDNETSSLKERLGITPVINETNNTLTYGLYPQSHVSDSSTIAALNKLTAESNGWYLYNNEYYAKKKANPYNSSYTFDDGTTIVSGTEYWFKCEPITWKILTSSNGTYSLVSTKLLDAHRYNEFYTGTKNGYYANNYMNSEIRSWLNGDFLNTAFNLDSSLIQTTLVDNSASTTNSSSNSYACANTNDKVYLLSYKDYSNTTYFADYSARTCKTTDYARANGIWYSTSSSYLYNGYYWTRSPYSDDSDRAWYVDGGGYLDYRYVIYSNGGVRPALTIKL